MPALLHVLLGAERGGCERCASMLIRYLPGVAHRVLVLGDDGPMCADFRRDGAAVEVVPRGEVATNGRLVRAVEARAAAHPPAAVMVWHGLVWLPQILRGLRATGATVGVYGGNPAHTLPRRADWKFVLLGRLFPAPRPVYICCSRYVADSFGTSRYLRPLPREVVYNGVPVPDRPAHQPRAYDPGRGFVVGMLARLDRMKDHPTLLRAFAAVRRRLPDVRLELAGGGDQDRPLRALAAELGVADAVRFHGDVADVYGVMAGWDVVAYPTTEREGLGSALIEGMMLGLPVVATDVGPIREVCGQPGAGVLVPPADPEALADALTALVPDLDRRRRLGARGREVAVELFHPEAFARRYAAVLFPGAGS